MRNLINIKIEKDGYGVELEVFDSDGCSQILSFNEQSIIDDIVTATDRVPDFLDEDDEGEPCSVCYDTDCNGQCMGDGLMGG